MVITAGLGESIPLLNGVASLTSEASSLNSTAASIKSLVASGTHTVSEIESKGIGVSMLPARFLGLPSFDCMHMLWPLVAVNPLHVFRTAMPCNHSRTQRGIGTDTQALLERDVLPHATDLMVLLCCRTSKEYRISMSTRLRSDGAPGGPLCWQSFLACSSALPLWLAALLSASASPGLQLPSPCCCGS